MRTRVLWMLPLICAPLFLGGCGDDSGTSAKDDESSSSVAKESSSSAKSSSSVASSSSKVEQLVPYTTECPAGKTCTYAPTEQLNPDIAYGEFLDTRDYQVYKTVTIGTQTWMAENLNYAYTGVKYNYRSYTSDSTSWCYENKASNCDKYGRLYTWSAVMDSAAQFSENAGTKCGFGTGCTPNSPHRGICPEGWHVPTNEEYSTLYTYIGGSSTAGSLLKSTSGWNDDYDGKSGNGTDKYGFSVLPAGYRDYYSGDFYNEGSSASLLSASEYDSDYAWYQYFCDNRDYESQYYSYKNKNDGQSLRCLRDSNDGGSEASSSSSQAKPSSSSSVIPGTAPESSSVIPSSSSSVIPSGVEESSSSVASSSSVDSSSSEMSSSETSSSSAKEPPAEIKADGYYKTNCPAGKTCTYAPTEQLNPDITYGEFLDTRDYQVYKTVTIDTQTWMAQNLNYAYTGVPYSYSRNTSDSTSWCYNNVADSCAKYGRLYTWAAAIDSVALAKDGYTCGYGKTCDRLTEETLAANPIRGVCPSGWHLPSYAEWDALHTAVGGSSTAGKALKSAIGWDDGGNGTDAYGFSALPAGKRRHVTDFIVAGINALFWSASQYEYSSNTAYYMDLPYRLEDAYLSDANKSNGSSIRCIKND